MAESDLIRGNVDTVILRVLYDGDRYGYDLIKQINAKSGGQWEIKQPTVYACLKRLEKQGFISSYWDSSESDGGRRKYYTLTDSGREIFLKYRGEYERASALFGGLIGSEPIFKSASDDFSDVEDEGYSVPKRPAKKRAAPPKPVQKPEEDVALEEEIEEPHDDGSRILDDDEKPSDMPAENTKHAEDARTLLENYYKAAAGQSYADSRGSYSYNDHAPAVRPAPTAPAPIAEPEKPAPVTPAAPPAPITEPVAPAPVEPIAPAPKPEPVAAKPAAVPASVYEDDESPARREYKTVLSDLVKRFEVAAPDVKREPAAAEQAAADEPAFDEPLGNIKQAALELGADVTVRSHNDSAKQYTQKFYYYNNRLRLTHYIIMCSSMLILGLILSLTFFVGLKMRMRYGYLLYIASGLLPIIMFITAVILYANNIDRKKRIDVNFKLSFIVRCVFMLQADVIIYCLNLIWGMPVGFSAEYIPSLIIPAVYAIFIPVSEVIFFTLLKSQHYAVE